MDATAAVVHEQSGDFNLEPVRLDALRADEVLVEIKGVGLCHTDIAARDGALPVPFPAVFGHEGSGIVAAVGSEVTRLKEGDAVALSFNSCGVCPQCAQHQPAYCHNFMGLNYGGARPDGTSPVASNGTALGANFFGQSSFATHAIANERNAVKVGDTSLPLELLGPLGCGLQTGAGAVMNSMAVRSGSSLLVLGAGPVGLAAVMGGVIQGCETIIVVEPHASRRELAKELGATHALDPSGGPLPEQVRAIVPEGTDYAFDTTGLSPVVAGAIESMRHRGTVGLVGVPGDFSENVPLTFITAMVLGLTVRGICEGDSDPHEFIPELLRLHGEGKFPFDKMIKTYPLSQINEAVHAQHAGDVVKVVLLNDAS